MRSANSGSQLVGLVGRRFCSAMAFFSNIAEKFPGSCEELPDDGPADVDDADDVAVVPVEEPDEAPEAELIAAGAVEVDSAAVGLVGRQTGLAAVQRENPIPTLI